MTEQTENMILEMLRRIGGGMDRLEADIGDMKLRLSAVETHLGQMQIQNAGINSRLDRMDERISRIERRLELVEV